ncbi:Hypothetical protein I595_673 [Croceitalea dokdonensis DOKDO 023]|uniref:Uncharacterized protein n=1 Tax=Croceitalea dokdonensis DOKDO 023 TaxID=1300341 RepID=A0A0P7B2Q2_9FLAO|nr:hypothetical protein [Croceitalea dokdonensis]KPM33767.1 Hypothetical protein I595_673 [Croceitalea dokdonensis DOKDO 023]
MKKISKDNKLGSPYTWKKEYTLVIVLNTLYILIFAYIMKANI